MTRKDKSKHKKKFLIIREVTIKGVLSHYLYDVHINNKHSTACCTHLIDLELSRCQRRKPPVWTENGKHLLTLLLWLEGVLYQRRPSLVDISAVIFSDTKILKKSFDDLFTILKMQ